MRIILGGALVPTPDGSTVKYTTSMSDPVPTATLNVIDNTSSFFPQRMQELLILDDQVTPYPAVNLLLNPSLNPYTSQWSTFSPPTGETLSTVGGGGFTVTFANAAAPPNNNYPVQQLTTIGSVVPGTTYTLSFYAQAVAPVNIQLNVVFALCSALGGTGVVATQTLIATPSTTLTRYSVTLTAPATASLAAVQLGTQITSSTNSGSITFTQIQLEPNWVPTLSYPTPYCGPSQANCVQLPLGYWIRQYRKFAGFVTHATYGNYQGNVRTVTVDAVGYAWLMSTILCTNSFTNQFDSAIIASLLAAYLTSNGTALCTTTLVIQQVQLSSVQSNWDDLRTLLDNLAAQSGGYWTIDNYWNMVYAPPGFFSMPIALLVDNSGTPDMITTFPAYGFSAEMDYTQPGSTILVIGGTSGATTYSALIIDGSTTVQNGIASGYFLPSGSSFMRKVNEDSLLSNADCTARGMAELLQYDNARGLYHLTTNVELLAGFGIRVTSNTDNLKQTTLLIQSVSAAWIGTDTTLTDVWEYQADLGGINRGATNILSRLFRNTNSNSAAPAIGVTTLALIEPLGLLESATTSAPPTATYASTVLGDGPIAYYHLGELSGTVAGDASGSGYYGTMSGTGITYNASALIVAPADGAMTFNGSTGTITLPTALIPTAANHAWSLEAWVNVPSLPASSHYYTLLGMGTALTREMGTLFIFNNGATTNFVLSCFSADITSSTTVSTSTTYHVVGTYDGTSTRLYVNGSLVAGPTAFSVTLVAGFATIGAENGANFLAGTLDEAAIYTYALSGAQISNHYAVGI